MKKVILDTDIGGDIDDAIALAYLLYQPDCDLIGITTVCGEPEKRAMVADALCKLAGKEIPIYAGEGEPLQPGEADPTPNGAAALERWDHSTKFEAGSAIDFLIRMVKKYPDEIHLVCIGNLTNIASCMEIDPGFAGKLGGLYLSAGYFGAEPLPDPSFNWNAWADPLAASIVFSAETRNLRTVPLEVTERLTLDWSANRDFLPESFPLTQAILDFGSPWLEENDALTFHDALAAMQVFEPDLISYQRGEVTVETDDPFTLAATTFHPGGWDRVHVAYDVDEKQFYEKLLSVFRTTEGSLKGKLLSFFAAENKRNWEDYRKFLHPDVTWRVAGKRDVNGRETYIAAMKSIYENDDVTFRCERMDVSADGNTINAAGERSLDIFQFEKGLIREEWEFLLGKE